MIIRNFISWVETAPDPLRAQATEALARAWVMSEFDEEERHEVETALTVLLDDPFPAVRLALAQVLAPSPTAPKHILFGLMDDIGEIASVVIKSAPKLADEDLLEALKRPDEVVQMAVVQRRVLSERVASTIASTSERAVCLALLRIHPAKLDAAAVHQIWQRHSDCAEVRTALLDMPQLAIHIRHDVLLKHALAVHAALPLSQDLTGTAVSLPLASGSMEDASDKIALRLAQDVEMEDLRLLVDYLRQTGQLHTRLLLRAVCIGRFRLLGVALSLLTSVREDRVFDLLATARPAALKALLKKAGIPLRVQQVFLLVADLVRQAEISFLEDLALSEARLLSEAVLDEIQDETLSIDGDLKVFMRKFVVDTARQEARAKVRVMGQKALAAA